AHRRKPILGKVAPRPADHNLKVTGSNPVPATRYKNSPAQPGLFLYLAHGGHRFAPAQGPARRRQTTPRDNDKSCPRYQIQKNRPSQKADRLFGFEAR
ncbi:hypothetical protein, partial [Mesorhizobium qingshengii]|uniref:hypothetical protein n=1 Tax=Mesorhizobium qingshengii TaxID=1165689 RepID=UPI001ABF16A0